MHFFDPSKHNEEEIHELFTKYREHKAKNLYEFEGKLKKSLGIDSLYSEESLDEFYREEDDGNYETIKWTRIPINTLLLHRQPGLNWRRNTALWCDYTGRITENDGKLSIIHDSFLSRPFFNNPIFHKLGKDLTMFRVLKELNIIHFPVNYNFDTTDLNVPAASENYIRKICDYDKATICLNGYTMDFLTFYNFSNLPSGYGTFFPGYREICILGGFNNPEYLEMLPMEEVMRITDELKISHGGRKQKRKKTKRRRRKRSYRRF
jgi:hypothetical protein